MLQENILMVVLNGGFKDKDIQKAEQYIFQCVGFQYRHKRQQQQQQKYFQ